jgi:hypothetical protein
MTDPQVKGSIASGTSDKRCVNDFYATPPGFTLELLTLEVFSTDIWEPAAGDGAISKVLRSQGYNVLETDLYPRASGIVVEDFLRSDRTGYDIITNPPFKFIVPFLEQSMRLCNRKFAVVLPISGLNSSKRYQAIWSKMPISKILLSGRYQHVRGDRGTIPSMFTHIWAIFDKEYVGPPTFHWTPDVVYKHD